MSSASLPSGSFPSGNVPSYIELTDDQTVEFRTLRYDPEFRDIQAVSEEVFQKMSSEQKASIVTVKLHNASKPFYLKTEDFTRLFSRATQEINKKAMDVFSTHARVINMATSSDQGLKIQQASPDARQQLLLLEQSVDSSKKVYDHYKVSLEKKDYPNPLDFIFMMKDCLRNHMDNLKQLISKYKGTGAQDKLETAVTKYGSVESLETELKTLTTKENELIDNESKNLNEKYSANLKEFNIQKEKYEKTKNHKNADELKAAWKKLGEAHTEKSLFSKAWTPDQYKKDEAAYIDESKKLVEFYSKLSKEKNSLLPDNSVWKKREGAQGFYYVNIDTGEKRIEFPRDDLLKKSQTLEESRQEIKKAFLLLRAGERTLDGLDKEQLNGKLYAITEELNQTKNCLISYEVDLLASETARLKKAYNEADNLFKSDSGNLKSITPAKNALSLYVNHIEDLIKKYEAINRHGESANLMKESSLADLKATLKIYTAIEKMNTTAEPFMSARSQQLKDPTLEKARAARDAGQQYLKNINEVIQACKESNIPDKVEKYQKYGSYIEKMVTELNSEITKSVSQTLQRLEEKKKELYNEIVKVKNEYDQSTNHANASSVIDLTNKFIKLVNELHDFKVTNLNDYSSLLETKPFEDYVDQIKKQKAFLIPDDSQWGRRPDGEYFIKRTQQNIGYHFPWDQIDNELRGLITELDRLNREKAGLEARQKAGELGVRTATGEDLEKIGTNISRLEEQIKQSQECLRVHPRPAPPPADLRPPASNFEV